MNSTPSAPSGKGMMIIIFVVVLVLLGVGGYFVYQKFFSSSSQCANKGSDKSSNVSTFVWDSKSSSCVANVCMDGFGSAATKGAPDANGNCFTFVPKGRSYTQILSKTGAQGGCTNDAKGVIKVASTTTASNNTNCANACDAATPPCLGYDWDGTSVCNLYSTTPIGTTGTPSNFTCFASK